MSFISRWELILLSLTLLLMLFVSIQNHMLPIRLHSHYSGCILYCEKKLARKADSINRFGGRRCG